jgi:formylglycine-generating enzyme required for sulfatase activity
VEQVTWDDAVNFCKLPNLPEEKRAGRVYRLPTEAEWEYACRAGRTTPFTFGDRLTPQDAVFGRDLGKALDRHGARRDILEQVETTRKAILSKK